MMQTLNTDSIIIKVNIPVLSLSLSKIIFLIIVF